eukprot:6214018-Pleurochrysis_carterae.AAC.1
MAAAAHGDGAQKGTIFAAVTLPSKAMFWHAGVSPVARSVSWLSSVCHPNRAQGGMVVCLEHR